MKPLAPVAPGARVALGVGFFVAFVAFWSALTFGGFVSKTFLADPLTMLKSGYTLLAEMGFAKDIGMTVWRVLGGFVIAALVALPLGVAMGAYKPVEAFFEPFVSFARYLPASAFIPLLILWVGIGEAAVVDRIAGEVLAGTFDPAKEVERQREAEREAERRSAADIAAARAGGEEQDRAFPGYRAAMARGDSAAALASLNAAFHERPASEAEGAYQWKLMLLLKRNRPADVNDYARHLLDAFPKNDDVVSFVAACLVATGEEARFDVRVAYEAAKTSDAAAKPGTRWAQFARWRLAWANYHVGNRAEAIRLADETLTAIGALKSTLDLDSLETECREALEIFKTQPQRAP